MVDNGSGASALLEVMIQLYRTGLNRRLRNRLRFAWWSGEELGLLGSRHYCRSLVNHQAENDGGERSRIVAYSNYDMLGSPNYLPQIHNGSTAPEAIRLASTKIQSVYEEYFQALPAHHMFANKFALSDMYGGSDYFSFLEVGIPAGGLDTGAGSLKTEEQRHRFGGLANAPYDPCYHRSCDTVENVNGAVLEVLARSAAHFVERMGVMENVREWLAGTGA